MKYVLLILLLFIEVQSLTLYYCRIIVNLKGNLRIIMRFDFGIKYFSNMLLIYID